MKIKFFKQEQSFKKKNFQPNAELFWRIAIIATFVIILLSFYFGYNLFVQTNKDTTASISPESGQVPMVSMDRMTKVLDFFTQKAQKSFQILNSSVPVVDPSL